MAEYLERFELLKKIDDELYLQQSTRSYLKMLVRKQHTADVVEVKHGYNANDTPSLFECSECGWSDGDTMTGDGEYNFCPNCGARMDGKENGNGNELSGVVGADAAAGDHRRGGQHNIGGK